MKGVLGHEVIHLMKDTGVLSQKQWSLMEKAADKGGWVEKHRIRDYYGDQADDYLLEEAIAREFQEYIKNPKEYTQPVGGIKGIFNKLRIFFDNLRNRFTKMGYKTPEALFNAVAGGEFAGQATGEPSSETGAMASLDAAGKIKMLRQKISETRKELNVEKQKKARKRDNKKIKNLENKIRSCLLYTSPSPRDRQKSRMPSSA